MATNFDITGLSNFTSADQREALRLTILEGEGIKDHYSWRDNVKYQTFIPNITDVGVDISTGALEGYNTPSGTTTVEDVTLTNTPFKIFEFYTKEKLTQKTLAFLSKKGTDPSELPMEALIMELKGKELYKENEKLLVQADTDASIQGNGDALAKFDGYIAQLRSSISDVGVPAGNVAGYGTPAVSWNDYSDASVVQAVETLVTAQEESLPQFVDVQTVMSMSPIKFAQYSRALYGLSTVVSKDTLGVNQKPLTEIQIPGTEIKVVKEIGFNGKEEVVLTIPDNVIAVYDLKSEDEILDFWYNRAAFRHELVAHYKLGLKVVDPSLCVMSIPALI